jgi:hypothetical protein
MAAERIELFRDATHLTTAERIAEAVVVQNIFHFVMT